MTDEPKRATAAEVSASLIDQANALILARDFSQVPLLLMAAGLFAIASAISEAKPPQ